MALAVSTASDGKYYVTDGADVVGGPFDTHAEAWRFLDRRCGDPISPAEKRSAFVVDQILNGGKLL